MRIPENKNSRYSVPHDGLISYTRSIIPTHFRTIWALKWHCLDLNKPFDPQKDHQRAQHGRVQSKIVHLCGYHPNYTYWTQYLEFQDFMLFHKSLMFSNNVIFWSPGGPNRFRTRCVRSFIVYISRLDHYMVFLTKYGAIQDFQRSKKCWKEAQQTQPWSPLGPP